jgi:hypothetical protein
MMAVVPVRCVWPFRFHDWRATAIVIFAVKNLGIREIVLFEHSQTGCAQEQGVPNAT